MKLLPNPEHVAILSVITLRRKQGPLGGGRGVLGLLHGGEEEARSSGRKRLDPPPFSEPHTGSL